MASERPLTLVTGASGHLGANLVRALLERGHEDVRVILRPQSNNSAMDGLPVQRVFADLTDRDSLRRAVQGVTYLYHCAAFVSIRPMDRDMLYRANIVGTKLLLEEALDAGVQRCVYVSSYGAIANSYPEISTEDSTFNPYEYYTDYELSKGVAEAEALRVAAKGLDVVLVNPSGIVGPHDYLPSLVGSAIIQFVRGRINAYFHGAVNYVPMRDVVDGCLLAMQHGRKGHRYMLTGTEHTLHEVFTWLHEFTGARIPLLKIPIPLMLFIAGVKDAFERRFLPHVAPRFTRFSIAILTGGKRASNAKAVRELGLRPTSVKDAFREQTLWLAQHGFITVRKTGSLYPLVQQSGKTKVSARASGAAVSDVEAARAAGSGSIVSVHAAGALLGTHPTRVVSRHSCSVAVRLPPGAATRVHVETRVNPEPEDEVYYWHSECDLSYEDVAAEAKAVLEQEKVLVEPRLAARYEQLAGKYWNQFYKSNTSNAFKPRNYLHKVFPECVQVDPDTGEPRAITLMEAGCGTGAAFYPLMKLNPNLHIVGFDISKRAIELVHEHENFDASRVVAWHMDLTKPEWPEEKVPRASVDLVSLIFVLSAIHPDKQVEVLRDLGSRLRPGAVMLFRDYGRYDLAEVRFAASRERGNHKLSEHFYVRSDGTRTYYYDLDELRGMLETAGYRVLELEWCLRKLENRKREITMHRVWVHGKFQWIGQHDAALAAPATDEDGTTSETGDADAGAAQSETGGAGADATTPPGAAP